ncbi:MAG TPA: glycosyltransferase family A protein [Rhizomicrobium sp.]
MTDVLVAIPTFRRPKGLARLLAALEALETHCRIEVLVADNDCDKSEGSRLCTDLRARGYRWPLHSIIVAERGIAQARNALVGHALAESRASFVAMLDDDEWPEAHWLDAFLRVQQQTGADALHGAVMRIFEAEPGPWAAHCQGIAPMHNPTGPIDMIHGTANVFLRRDCLFRLGSPWFDPAFALTGGEDKEFFTRLRRQGARFAWADEAIAFAHVPASRSNLLWALKRAYRVGNSDMRVFLKHEGNASALASEGLRIAGAMLLSPVGLALHAASPGERTADLCRLWRAAGKIAAVCGGRHNEYATIHGE